MFISSHFCDFLLSSSSTLPRGCSAEATLEEVEEVLFFRIPLMGRCEAVEAAIAGSSGCRLRVAAGVGSGKRRVGRLAETRQAAAEPARSESSRPWCRGNGSGRRCHAATTPTPEPTPPGWRPFARPSPPAFYPRPAERGRPRAPPRERR